MPVLLLTPEQAAEALRLGRTRVYEEMASGRLASVKIGRSRRVPVEALRRYVEQLEAEQRSVHELPEFVHRPPDDPRFDAARADRER